MASRRPLVQDTGRLAELPSGDTLLLGGIELQQVDEPPAPGVSSVRLYLDANGDLILVRPDGSTARIDVTAVDVTAPTITSANPSGSYIEGVAIGGTLTANETVTWAKSGADGDAVTLDTDTGVWSLEATDYDIKSSYGWTFTATDAGGNSADQIVTIAITEAIASVQYGRTPGYNAGTAGDWFVAPDGSDAAPGTSVAAPFATLGKALSVATAGQTIRLRGGADEASIVKYRESNTITSKNNLRIASYGTEYAELSGALRVTGFTACTSGDEAAVGPNYASVYKATVATSAIEHTSYHALILTEADVPLDLVQMRRDMTDLFALDDYTTMYAAQAGDDVDITTDGSGYFATISHPSVLNNYTDAQLARCSVAVHVDPNVIGVLKVASASGGVLTLASNTKTPDVDPNGERYALLNILPEIAAGQWAYVDNGDGTLTIYVWPTNPATINASIDIAARKHVLTVNTSTGLEVDGLYIGQCSGDYNYDCSAVVLNGSGGSVHDLHCRNFSAGEKGYGAIYANACSGMSIANNTIRHGQNSFGHFLNAGTGNRCKAIDAKRVSQTPVRVYGESLIAVIDIRAELCGYGAHANLFNFYVGCDRWVIIGYNPVDNTGGYGTNQRSSRGLVLNSIMTIGPDGRGYDDQGGSGAGIAPVNPSDNYFINNFVWHDPARVTSATVKLGDTTDGTNWYAYNNVVPSIFEKEAGTLLARKNNVLTNQAAVDASETAVSNALDAFYDPAGYNYKTVPGSPLLTKAGFDVESVISTYESWFPDVDFRRDITGAVWNPADPGVGPYGKAWPVQSDSTAPVLSAFDAGTPGPLGSTCSVTTDEVGGALYWVRLADGATTPSAAQIVAGQDSTGAAAGESGNQAVTAVGAQSFAITGTSATTYKIAAVHKDRNGNPSNVLTGNVTLAGAFSPVWTLFEGQQWLARTASLVGAQAASKSMLLAMTLKMTAAQVAAAGTSAGAVNTLPTTDGGMSIDTTQVTTNKRIRVKLRQAGSSTSAADHSIPPSGSFVADAEYLVLVSFSSDAGGFVSNGAIVQISDGSMGLAQPPTDSGADTALKFAGTTKFDLFRIDGNADSDDGLYVERFVLWDNATADVTSPATHGHFFVDGALLDPAIAIAALGQPLISITGAALGTGANAGSGGDFTPVTA